MLKSDNKKQLLKLISCLILSCLLTSGYGYMGNLPQLGKTTKEQKPVSYEKIKNNNKIFQKFKPTNVIIPRATKGKHLDKYSSYLTDIKEVYGLLQDIKKILQENHKDKIQLFCAKVNVLNLYVDNFEKKYGERPESFYETYKQLVVLDKYLKEIVDFKKGMENYEALNTGTLENKLRDEQFLEQKIEKAIIPISTVIEIIDETG